MEHINDRPSAAQIDREISRRKRRGRAYRAIRSTLYGLLAVAAVAVLTSTLFFPVLKIYGSSMAPTLREGEIVVCRRNAAVRPGDMIAFYYNNKILVKRVVARAGDWVNMRDDGAVFVNGVELAEPYVTERGFGSCDLELPYQVPDGQYFVMGDTRTSSVDSRLSQIGCVSKERIVGRLVLRIWPLDGLGRFTLRR